MMRNATTAGPGLPAAGDQSIVVLQVLLAVLFGCIVLCTCLLCRCWVRRVLAIGRCFLRIFCCCCYSSPSSSKPASTPSSSDVRRKSGKPSSPPPLAPEQRKPSSDDEAESAAVADRKQRKRGGVRVPSVILETPSLLPLLRKSLERYQERDATIRRMSAEVTPTARRDYTLPYMPRASGGGSSK
jgi:hypothetical protein